MAVRSLNHINGARTVRDLKLIIPFVNNLSSKMQNDRNAVMLSFLLAADVNNTDGRKLHTKMYYARLLYANGPWPPIAECYTSIGRSLMADIPKYTTKAGQHLHT